MQSLLTALGLVFLAELGDKTQLVAMGLGARHRFAPVVVGVTLAYAATNLVSVVVGGALGEALPARAVAIGGGALFLVFAARELYGGLSSGSDDADASAEAAELTSRGRGAGRVVLSVAAAMFVAELGDKTMLATATLAARGDPVLVWIGATIGIVASGLVGVVLGRAVGARIPERAARFGAGALFTVFGVALIATNL